MYVDESTFKKVEICWNDIEFHFFLGTLNNEDVESMFGQLRQMSKGKKPRQAYYTIGTIALHYIGCKGGGSKRIKTSRHVHRVAVAVLYLECFIYIAAAIVFGLFLPIYDMYYGR